MSEFVGDRDFEQARLGVEAEAFLSGNLGRFVVAKAEQEIEEAYKALAKVDPDDAKSIRALQNAIAVARRAPEWLALAVQDGRVAEERIREEDQFGD